MARRKAYIAALDLYPNPANNLPSCVNDAEAFRQTITEVHAFSDIRFDYNEKATLRNVEAGLRWLFDGAAADDRLVFYFSGHGFQSRNGQDLEEVLCLYDEFLFDNALSQMSQAVPPGVFTLISDSCHSGGMYKAVMVDGQTEVAQTKVLKVPPIAEQSKVFLDTRELAQLRYRPFGARHASASAVAKRFGLESQKEFDEVGQLQMNGLLLSACLADETASASTARTAGKSAFTYALLERLKALGPRVSNQQLIAETSSLLRQLGFRQTPVLMQPARPPNLGGTSFLLLEGQTAPTPSTTTSPAGDDWISEIINRVLGNMRKDFAMTTATYGQPATVGDQKLWGLIANIASIALPAVIGALRKGGYEPQKDFVAEPGGEDKFWRTLLNVVTTAVPAVVQALRKGGYEPQKDFSGSQEKILGSMFQIVTRCLPIVLREITKEGIEPQKDFGGEEKFWGAIGSALSAALPAVLSALTKQGMTAKGFEDAPAGDEKFFRAIGRIVSTVAPIVLHALSKSGVDPQKDFQKDGQEKFFGALMAVVGTVAPIVVQALSKSGVDPQKEFGGEEKFWGAFASVVQAALPAVIGALRKGDMDVGKNFAAADGADGDAKLWGVIARVVASTIPAIVGELTKSGVGMGNGKAAEPLVYAPSLAPSAMPPHLIDDIVSSITPSLQSTH